MRKYVAVNVTANPQRIQVDDLGIGDVVGGIQIRPPDSPAPNIYLMVIEFQTNEIAAWSASAQDAPWIELDLMVGPGELVIDAPIGSIATFYSEVPKC